MLFEAGTRTRTSRSGWRNGTIGRGVTGQGIMATDRMRRLGAWALVVCAVLVAACAAQPTAAPPSPPTSRTSPAASPTASVAPALITFAAGRDAAQAPRFIAGRWSATVPLRDLRLTVFPEPAFACRATIDPAGRSGTYGCDGLFPPLADLRIELVGTTSDGARAAGARAMHTMGDRLTGVPWFTEFEDPNGEALACAAASARIIQAFTTGRDT